MTTTVMPTRPAGVNLVGLTKTDYKGAPSTLCNGCGHDSIASQIIAVAYDLSLEPHRIAKFSGIGCSSKSPTYFLNRSFGFNGLHGRMPPVATGTSLSPTSLASIAVVPPSPAAPPVPSVLASLPLGLASPKESAV